MARVEVMVCESDHINVAVAECCEKCQLTQKHTYCNMS